MKNRVVVESVLAGLSQSEAARRYGLSQPRVSQLMARYRAGGFDALAPGSRRPRSSPASTPAHIVTAVLALRAELVAAGLDAGADTIAVLLARAGTTPPSRASINRILTRAGAVTPAPRKRPKSSYTRFEAALPNECWQADFTHCATATGHAEVLIWLDDHSRFITGITAHTRVTGPAVVTAFRAAVAAHGEPASTLTDNGVVFTARFIKGVCAFELELAARGIVQKNGHPGHPQTQGKVERLNQTLKRWLAARPLPADITALQTLLDEFTHHYNNHRPHRSLQGRTPAAAYTARAKATPEHQPRPTWRLRNDTVHTTGNITLRQPGRIHHIGIGTRHKNTPVRLLIHDLNILIINTTTGEILRDITLDPDKDYQPLGTPPGPPKGTPRQGGIKKGSKHPKK